MLYVQDIFGEYMLADSQTIIGEAKRCISRQFKKGTALTSPDKVRDLLYLNYSQYEYEVFVGIFLDNQHRIIDRKELFRGTIDGASVYPREVAKEALKMNAAAVIFCHPHPSGIAEPSQADRHITDKLKQALALFDIRVLDHFIIGGEGIYSFAEHGLM